MAEHAGASQLAQIERHLLAGGEFLRKNRVEEARDKFLEALAIDRYSEKALGLLGLAYFRLADFVGALPIYQQLVELDRNDASYWLNLGLVHLKLNDPESAITELRCSRELDPSQSRAVSYLGLAHARNGEYAEAYLAFLQAGQTDLAREMEQYLSPEQRAEIAASAVADRGDSEADAAGAKAGAKADAKPGARAGVDVELTEDDILESEDDIEIVEAAEEETAAEDEAAARVEAPPERASGEIETASPPGDGAAASAVTAAPDDGERAAAIERGDAPAAEVGEPAVGEPAASASEGAGEAAEAAEAGASVPVETAVAQRLATTKSPDDDASPASSDASPAPDEAAPTSRGDGAGAISEAVARALPSTAAQVGAGRVGIGHQPPQSLTEFATSHLLRPEEGDHAFEIGAHGVLIVHVSGRVYSRTEGVGVTGGELAYEVASRHERGSSTGQSFSADGRPLFIVSGRGHLIATSLGERFTAVTLDDDILYLREDLVFAFEDRLSWENGHVPGSGGTIGMVQFRGSGSAVFRTTKPLLAIKLAPERILHVDAKILAGWIGRVVPKAVTPIGGGKKSTLFVECSGEGVVLVEESVADVWAGIGAGARDPASGSRT